MIESQKTPNLLYQVHLFFTFFLFLIMPNIEFSFEINLPTTVFLMLAFLNFLLCITVIIAEGRFFLPYKNALVFFLLYCLYVIGHFIIGPQSDEGRNQTIHTLLMFFLVISISQVIRSPKSGLLFLIGFIFNGVLQILRGVNQIFIVYPELKEMDKALLKQYMESGSEVNFFERIENGLASGSFLYPNAYAVWLVLFIFSIIYLFKYIQIFKNYKEIRLLLIFFILGALYGIYLAGAKGVMISMLIVIVSTLLLWSKNKTQKFISTKSIFTFLFFLGSILSIGLILLSDKILSLKVRIQYWSAGLNMYFSENGKLFGLGNSGFTHYFTKYKLPEGEEVQKAHNIFMTTVVEQGFIGFIIFAFVCIFFVFEIAKQKDNQTLVKKNINETHDFALPENAYIFIFYMLFAIFIFLNPNVSKVSLQLSYYTPITMFLLFFILIARFLKNKNIFKSLALEKELVFQIFFLSSLMIVCFMDVSYALYEIENWPNFELINEKSSALCVLVICLLFFFFISKRRDNLDSIKEKLKGNIIGIALVLFFILMISGDMVFEFSIIPISFFVLLTFECVINEKNYEVELSHSFGPIAFALIGFSFSFFLFQKFVNSEISITKYKYIYEYWIQKKGTIKESVSETKEVVLDSGKEKFPYMLYFPLEKAKFYYQLGVFYKNSGHKSQMNMWYEKAISEIDLCIKQVPQKPRLYDFKADLIEDSGGLYSDVLNNRKLAIHYYPTKPYYLMKLGESYVKQNEHKEAIKYFQKALDLNKNVHRYTRLKEEEFERIQRYMVENNKKSDMNSTAE